MQCLNFNDHSTSGIYNENNAYNQLSFRMLFRNSIFQLIDCSAKVTDDNVCCYLLHSGDSHALGCPEVAGA